MTAPTITPEQRDEALRKAQETRQERARLLTGVRRGDIAPAIVLTRDDPAVARMKVRNLVKATPTYGLAKTEELMTTIGIHRDRRVGGLSDRQRAALVEALS